MSIVALYSSRSGSGKTTVANALGGHGYRRLSFADPLRAMARVVLDRIDPAADLLAAEHKRRPLHALHGKDPTDLMIAIGQGMRDAIHPDFWVDRLVDRLATAGPLVVIDDVRQPNEHAWLRRRGALLVRIDRPGGGVARGMDGLLDGFDFDLTIGNTFGDARAFALHACAAIARQQGMS